MNNKYNIKLPKIYLEIQYVLLSERLKENLKELFPKNNREGCIT